VTECGCEPGTDRPDWLTTPFRPFHFYDEQRLVLTRPAGTFTVSRHLLVDGRTASPSTAART